LDASAVVLREREKSVMFVSCVPVMVELNDDDGRVVPKNVGWLVPVCDAFKMLWIVPLAAADSFNSGTLVEPT
jgi:hypothetical protein